MRRAPARLLLGYLLTVVGLVVLAPFDFAWPDAPRLSWLLRPTDVVGNVLLFAPLGFVYRLGLGPGARAGQARAAAVGALVSGALELGQLALPGRFPSPVDLATNTLGAWLGALGLERLETRFEGRRLRPLALELPLMTLLYLLVPLLWLDGLAAGRESRRLLLAALPGLAGGLVLAAVWRHRLAARGWLDPGRLAGVAGVWFLVAAAPGLVRRPGAVVATAAAIALVTFLEARRPLPAPVDRRFELPTLRRIWPVLGGYLLAAGLWPLPWTPGPWQGGWALADLASTPGIVPLLRAVESTAGFTLLGYTVAEARGRRPEPRRRLMAWVLGVCLGGGAVLEALRGFHPEHGASAAALGLAGLAGAYGGLLYRAQLALIRRVLGQGAAAESPIPGAPGRGAGPRPVDLTGGPGPE